MSADLIERLRCASGPSRELDRDVLFEIFPRERVATFDGVRHISTITGADGSPWFTPLADRLDCPRFTKSLDDIVDWCEGAGISWRVWSTLEGGYAADAFKKFKDSSPDPTGLGRTAAIALCIAMLKARADAASDIAA